jgi:hypothetical protein
VEYRAVIVTGATRPSGTFTGEEPKMDVNKLISEMLSDQRLNPFAILSYPSEAHVSELASLSPEERERVYSALEAEGLRPGREAVDDFILRRDDPDRAAAMDSQYYDRLDADDSMSARAL